MLPAWTKRSHLGIPGWHLGALAVKRNMGTRLYRTAMVEEQWRTLAAPWLRQRGKDAWRSIAPTVVLTPSRALGFYLRGRIVAEGTPLLGVRFWTPTDLRRHLHRQLRPGLGAPTRADLRLLARLVTEKVVAKDGAEEESIRRGVAQEPESFLRSYDILLGAGWEPERDGVAYARALAREFTRELKRLDVATQAGLHWRLRQESEGLLDKILGPLLVVGFDATHWPLWDLLQAAVGASREATVLLSEPRVFGEEIDQLWISSWEALHAGAEPPEIGEVIPENRLAGIAAVYERGAYEAQPEAPLDFILNDEVHSQARAVVLRALSYLAHESCHRLGIVFPAPNALSLGVTDELRRLGILLDDGTGAEIPGLFEKRFWRAWLELQEEPRVETAIAWIRSCEAAGMRWEIGESMGQSSRQLANRLEKALAETLMDDLPFLARYLESPADPPSRSGRAVAAWLRQRPQLPERATFAEFLQRTREAVAAYAWAAHADQLKPERAPWLIDHPQPVSRHAFLDWLKETTDSRNRTRDNHFYGKVHLLTYGQLPGQTWSHLILTGLNEGVWPHGFEAGGFGSRHELAVLNAQARRLNLSVTGEGSQGAGHLVLREGKGHCLLPQERLDLALRDLCAALESTSERACLAALSAEAGRALLPSDFYGHLYQLATGKSPDDATWADVAEATLRWTRTHRHLLEIPADRVGAEETRQAYAARRDPALPFGRFEFAFEKPPHPIQLPCKAWESALRHPAPVWLEKVIGAAPWPKALLSWQQAVGAWTHRWLRLALLDSAGSGADVLSGLRNHSSQDAARMHAMARDSGSGLHIWWDHVHQQAAAIAEALGAALIPHLAGKKIFCELPLAEELAVALPGGREADFTLRGRIDFLLVEKMELSPEPEGAPYAHSAAWIIDFKTGGGGKLTPGQVQKGIGLQAILYGLAIRAQGAERVSISLARPGLTLEKPLDLAKTTAQEQPFRLLEKFHREGVFGLRPASGYGFAPAYPIAFRPIASDILEAKWKLTHGEADSDVAEGEA